MFAARWRIYRRRFTRFSEHGRLHAGSYGVAVVGACVQAIRIRDDRKNAASESKDTGLRSDSASFGRYAQGERNSNRISAARTPAGTCPRSPPDALRLPRDRDRSEERRVGKE